MNTWIERIGLISGVVLPLFNIPLIARLIQRKRSDDFSLSWAFGVWTCMLLMTPQALRSQDMTFKIFGLMNIVFFSVVVFFVCKYRK